MSFLAVAMSSGGADLSDDQSPAVGPTTIYAFLLVGGLYNLVLTGSAATRAAGLLLYLFTLAAYWADGIARAEICFDAEAIRAPRLRVADGATLSLIAALTGRGVASVGAAARGSALAAVLGLGLGVRLVLAAAGLHLLRRARTPAVDHGWQRLHRWRLPAVALALSIAVGAAGVAIGPSLAGIAADEIIWRGVLQGAIERNLQQRTGGVLRARLLAGVVTLGLSAAALLLTGSASVAALTAITAATAARAATGRLSGALAARFALIVTQLAMGVFR